MISSKRPARRGATAYRRFFAVLLAVPLTLTACGGADKGSDDGGEAASDLSFAVVSHGSAGDKFWDVVKSGAEQAGEDLGVKVSYQGSGDPNQQSQLIDNAVSEKVDGIVVSMANPDALKEAIGKAVAAGIPVITINSGVERSKEFGALTHVGQTERIAGEAAGVVDLDLAGEGVAIGLGGIEPSEVHPSLPAPDPRRIGAEGDHRGVDEPRRRSAYWTIRSRQRAQSGSVRSTTSNSRLATEPTNTASALAPRRDSIIHAVSTTTGAGTTKWV